MSVVEQIPETETQPCIVCEGEGEVESDGKTQYFDCPDCGSRFGYQTISVPDTNGCQLGVPEDVRAAYADQHAVASQQTMTANANTRLPMFGEHSHG